MNKSLVKKTLSISGVLIMVMMAVVLIIGYMTIEKQYLKITAEDKQLLVYELAEAVDMMNPEPIPLDVPGIIVKVYDASGNEITQTPKPTIMLNQADETLTWGMPTDKTIRNLLMPYMSTVFEDKDVRIIGSINDLSDRSIIIGVPIKDGTGVVGALFYLEPSVDFDRLMVRYIQIYIITMVILSVGILIMLYVLLKKVVQPLNKMSDVAHHMSTGDYGQRLDEDGYSEVRQLAESMNMLSKNLASEKERSAKLKQYREAYFSDVSHELRSPLVAVKAMAEAIHDGMVKDEETREHYMSIILKETYRMENLIQDMMILSKLRSDDGDIVRNKVNLNQVIQESYNKYAVIADDMGLDFSVEVLPEDAVVMTEENTIIQVLGSLIDNSFKFTGEDGKIQVLLKRKDDGYLVKVIDNGCGVPKEDIPFIFERYYKVDKSRAMIGSGLGLSIAKRLLDRLGETIWMEETEGGGATFIFSIH